MMRRMGSSGLGYGQVFLLIIGFGIASALIFLFGIWVGRDVAERRLAQEERVVRQPILVPPAPQEEAKEPEVDLAFYEKLKEKAAQRLEATAAAAASATAARVAQAPTATRAAARPSPHATPAAHLKPTEARQFDVWADAGWTVQVNATTDPQQAMELARSLKSKGYDAYTVQSPMRGQTWYRVRVGRFTSREKAKELENRLKTAEHFENAYVTAQ